MNPTIEPAIDIIIATKDRAEIVDCVHSLLQVQAVAKIVICDGGSSDLDAKEALQTLESSKKIRIACFPDSGFNKARLLNQGILQATSNYVLVSDADILWSTATIETLLSLVLSQPNSIYYVQNVRESSADSIALQRDRYTYQVYQNAETTCVEILLAERGHHRPGCGLICTRRETLLKLGGYKELFQGWGWEDQDLLIRAKLLGVTVGESGEVTHLSHTDQKRNRYHNNLQPSQTRDRNIIICLEALAAGKLFGSLAVEVDQIPPSRISIKIPNSLAC